MIGDSSPVLPGDVFLIRQFESRIGQFGIYLRPRDEAHEIGDNPDRPRVARISDRAVLWSTDHPDLPIDST